MEAIRDVLAPQQLKGIGGIARFSPPDADALEKEHMAFHSAKAGPMSIKKGFIFALVRAIFIKNLNFTCPIKYL